MKKRNPSSGQNGQLVHWWLLIHSGQTQATNYIGYFSYLNIGFHWGGNQFNDNLERYENLKGYERKLVPIFN
jgi:hypothetical protein